MPKPQLDFETSSTYFPTLDEWMLTARFYVEGILFREHTWWNKSINVCQFMYAAWSMSSICLTLPQEEVDPPPQQLELPF